MASGELVSRIKGLPQAERAEPADRSLADADDSEIAGRSLRGSAERSAGAHEVERRTGPDRGSGEHRDGASATRRSVGGQRSNVEVAPSPVPVPESKSHVPRLVSASPSVRDRVSCQESIEVLLVIPDREYRAPTGIDRRTRVRAASGSERPDEPEPLHRIELPMVEAESSEDQTLSTAPFGHEVERRNRAHDPPCWHPCRRRSRSWW